MTGLRPAIAALLLAGFAAKAAPAPVATPRVVTLSPHLAELVCAAGACSQLVAVTAWSDYPPQVKSLPQVGDGFSVNAEAVLQTHPDLVLAWAGGTPVATIAKLRRVGLRVESVDAKSVDDVADALLKIGSWLGTDAAAQTAAAAYRGRLAALRAAHRADVPIRVVYQIETAPAFTINRDSPISAALAICGGINVFAALPTLSASIDAESMLAAQPEAVLYGSAESTAAIRAYWARLSATPAARRGAFYAVDGNLLERATPRLLEGVEQVCSRLDDARRKRAAIP
jgi:ABC-type hemin transport system substrate-binding protein